jgi:N-acetylglucosamine-6-phosphate deacetylase
LVGLPLEQALRTVTHVPAKVLGLRKGRLAPGYDADILLLDDDLRPGLTLVRGQIVFDRA